MGSGGGGGGSQVDPMEDAISGEEYAQMTVGEKYLYEKQNPDKFNTLGSGGKFRGGFRSKKTRDFLDNLEGRGFSSFEIANLIDKVTMDPEVLGLDAPGELDGGQSGSSMFDGSGYAPLVGIDLGGLVPNPGRTYFGDRRRGGFLDDRERQDLIKAYIEESTRVFADTKQSLQDQKTLERGERKTKEFEKLQAEAAGLAPDQEGRLREKARQQTKSMEFLEELQQGTSARKAKRGGIVQIAGRTRPM
jgi:hypothetical protein